MVLSQVEITAEGTVWTVSGVVGTVPVSIPIDLAQLANDFGRVPTMAEIQNQLVTRLRQEYINYEVGQMAANPPASVPDIEF